MAHEALATAANVAQIVSAFPLLVLGYRAFLDWKGERDLKHLRSALQKLGGSTWLVVRPKLQAAARVGLRTGELLAMWDKGELSVRLATFGDCEPR